MQLEKPEFGDLLDLLSQKFKAKIVNQYFEIQPQFGKGYFWTEKLPSGITVLVSDTCLQETLVIDRPESEDYYFTLQFH